LNKFRLQSLLDLFLKAAVNRCSICSIRFISRARQFLLGALRFVAGTGRVSASDSLEFIAYLFLFQIALFSFCGTPPFGLLLLARLPLRARGTSVPCVSRLLSNQILLFLPAQLFAVFHLV
jgi:hypothetical protein